MFFGYCKKKKKKRCFNDDHMSKRILLKPHKCDASVSNKIEAACDATLVTKWDAGLGLWILHLADEVFATIG